MKTVILALAGCFGALSIAGSATAAESALFPVYDQICVANNQNPDRALAAADKAGWAGVPEGFLQSTLKGAGGLDLKSGDMKAMVLNKQLMMLIAGHVDMQDNDPKMEADLCAVVSFTTQTDSMLRDIRAYTGAAPVKTDDKDLQGLSVWLFSDGPKGRQYFSSVTGKPAMRAMVNGDLHMLMAGEESGMSVIMLMRPVVVE